MKLKTNYCWLLLFVSISCFGQIDQYDYKQELNGIVDTWHTITLPNEIFEHTKANLSDVRIFGILSNDTIEAPYLIHQTKEEVTQKGAQFKQLNMTHNQSGNFVSFEVPSLQTINRITTGFKNENFDWKIKLEGSQDQKSWFTILDDYRILSIKNGQTNYQFTDLVFPDSKYQYYRIHLKTKEKVTLVDANLLRKEVTQGVFRTHSIKNKSIIENKDLRQTEMEVDLGMPLSLSQFTLDVNSKFDYYRPIAIQAVKDSVETAKGMKYSYRTLAMGTLNSMESNTFSFKHTVAQKIKISIRNHDNQPLTIDGVTVKGYLHKLVARFSDSGDYILVYGNKKARSPQYDIQRFTDKIPASNRELTLGEQTVIDKSHLPKTPVVKPLFENQFWLWAIMILIILLLGGFTISMIRKT